jgi:hypothetical protein
MHKSLVESFYTGCKHIFIFRLKYKMITNELKESHLMLPIDTKTFVFSCVEMRCSYIEKKERKKVKIEGLQSDQQ